MSLQLISISLVGQGRGEDRVLGQVQPLRSLKTATKKRRALKKKAAQNSGSTKSSTTASG
jgi:hypothetical protein